jgi:hypothetical protein
MFGFEWWVMRSTIFGGIAVANWWLLRRARKR